MAQSSLRDLMSYMFFLEFHPFGIFNLILIYLQVLVSRSRF